MLKCVKFQAPNSKFQFKRRLALYFCWDWDFGFCYLGFEFLVRKETKKQGSLQGFRLGIGFDFGLNGMFLLLNFFFYFKNFLLTHS